MEGVKWSRNLSANNQSEIKRMRQITKQKMETKRNKQQQPMVIPTRQKSARTTKSAFLRKSDTNDSSQVSTNSSSENVSIEDELTKNLLIDQFKEKFDIKDDRTSKDSKDSLPKNHRKPETQQKIALKSQSNLSQTHSAEEDNLEESSEDESPVESAKKMSKSKSTFNLNDFTDKKMINNLNSSLDKNMTIVPNKPRDINPLKTLLNNSELLEFVTNPVPRNKVYQCTIIRDKKGLDRSLYPTYYMHLQAINSKDDNQKLKLEDFKDNGSRREDSNSTTSNAVNSISNVILNGTANGTANGKANGKTHLNNDSTNGENQNRQAFLLSGRRRKKAKTYFISCNPFEINRQNSIAKLKSNMVGTLFNTYRMLPDNHRIDYATIIYGTNILGFKGPRKMTILIPQTKSNNYYKLISMNSEISLLDLNKTDPKSVTILKNRTPQWSEETQSYVLNFKGRVTQASVKNFQLEQCDLADELESRSKEDLIEIQNAIEKPKSPTTEPEHSLTQSTFISNDFISMQFGKISDSQFTCDVSHPLSLLQAFSIALSSCDPKLVCD